MKRKRNKPKGWRNEPVRHGLASQGVKTTTKGKQSINKKTNERITELLDKLDNTFNEYDIQVMNWEELGIPHESEKEGVKIFNLDMEGEPIITIYVGNELIVPRLGDEYVIGDGLGAAVIENTYAYHKPYESKNIENWQVDEDIKEIKKILKEFGINKIGMAV